MKDIQWRIYYDDGSTFDSTQGGPEVAPPYGVIAIAGYDELGERMILQKWNHYWCKEYSGRPIWYGSDLTGLLDQLHHDTQRAISGVKLGRTIPNAEFNAIVSTASHDPDFTVTTRQVYRNRPRDVS